jgi:hypothetical protein
MIKTDWDSPFGPSGSVWKGPRKKNQVYVDRYDHRGLEELCEVQMTAGEGPSDLTLKKAEEKAREVLPLYLEREELSKKVELSPAERTRKLELDRFFHTRWKKLPSRVRKAVETRARAAWGTFSLKEQGQLIECRARVEHILFLRAHPEAESMRVRRWVGQLLGEAHRLWREMPLQARLEVMAEHGGKIPF